MPKLTNAHSTKLTRLLLASGVAAVTVAIGGSVNRTALSIVIIGASIGVGVVVRSMAGALSTMP